MTTDKARKRAVRTRMTKTGESYTAAQRQVAREADAPPLSAQTVEQAVEQPPATPPPAAQAEPPVSEAAIVRATGRSWDDWLRILDARGIDGFSHGDTAAWLVAELGISGWWSQAVTVGFERARGLRAVNQTTAGFSVGVTKTLDVPVDAVYRAVVDEGEHDRWLPAGTLQLRTAAPYKSARFDFREGASRVVVDFLAKGPDRVTLSIQHERLAGAEEVEPMRALWRTAMANLAASMRRP